MPARGGVSTAGRAKLVLAIVLAGACAALVGALLIRGAERGSPEVAIPSLDAPAPRPEATGLSRSPVGGSGESTSAPSALPRASPRPGVIRGELLVHDPSGVPERWTLHVGPHPWLAGKETAEDRRIEFEHGETGFELHDLPLGGYLVEALARGRNCLPGNVMLVRGSEDQFVSILLSPSGTLDGGVLDSAGRPAEGLDVTLESVPTGERRTLTTDAAGTFVFREVIDGEYRLLYGRPDSPILPPQSLVFQAPSMRFPTRTLPAAASLRILVVDARLRPVAGARISGSAASGGAVDATSDESGTARVAYLPSGSYRLDARTDQGAEGSSVIALAAGQDASLRIQVRDRSSRRE